MTSRSATRAAKAKTPKKLVVDAEARALMANPVFRAMLDEARPTRPEDLAPWEELGERLGLTAADKALADEYLAVFDRLEAAQDAEVTGEQAHVLNVVLIGARYLRGERTLGEWAEYTGLAAEEIQAAAVALEALGVKAPRPTARAG